jgi:predicted transport protein
MSDIKLFKIAGGSVKELESKSVGVEKSLQTLIEKHLEVFLGVTFLATEYTTGKKHGGRIDTLGVDENGCPVIIEYKRKSDENVINQGLFYLDWLMDHQAQFKLLVMEKLGEEVAKSIDWTGPRLLCVALDFTKYDEHAVQQINRNIELIRYRRYGDELFILELVNAVTAQTSGGTGGGTTLSYKTAEEQLAGADQGVVELFEAVKDYLLSFGDDVQMKTLKFYFAFKRIKNFACVELRTQKKDVLVFVKVDPATITLTKGFTRDVRNIGHFGTGDLEITLRSLEDIEKAKPLLEQSYANS